MKKLLVFLVLFQTVLQAQITVGDSLMTIGDYGNAMKAYVGARVTAERYFKMARVSTAIGDNDTAIDTYLDGMQLDSVDVRARFEFGKLLLKKRELPSALGIFERLIEDQPENATYHYYTGMVMSELKRDKTAIEYFMEALKRNDDYRAARIELLISLIKTNKSFVALRIAENYLKDHPDDIKINSLYAQALMNSKNYKNATEAFEHLFDLGSDTEYNRKSLALAYYHTQEYEKSLENYEKFLVDYDDKDPNSYYMMSMSYLKLNELDKAQDYVERAIVFKTPILDKEYMQLASVYANKKDLKNTLGALKAAAKEAPNNDDIAYQVVLGADRYYQDKSEKLKYYKRFIEKFPESDYRDMAQARASDLRKDIFMNAKGDD